MKKHLILGILLSAALIYLSIRDIDPGRVWNILKDIRYGYVFPFVITVFVMQWLRVWRWGVILDPIEKVNFLSLFSVTNVGFLAITAIPARLGELARPYLITQKSRIKMTAALGTIVVERVFDSLTVLIMALVVFFVIPLPSWLVRSGILVSILTFLLLTAMIFMTIRRETAMKVLDPMLKWMPSRYALRLNGMVHHFIDGFQMITDFRRFTYVAGLSILIWVVDILAIYFMFMAFSFDLSVAAAVVVMIILLIGIAMPTAPGFVGNWHYACVLGLTLFGVPKADALSFAIVYHFLSLAMIILLGVICLPFNRFSLADLKYQMTAIK